MKTNFWRLGFFFSLLLSCFLLPWEITVCGALLFLIFFEGFEIVCIGFLLDLIWGEGEHVWQKSAFLLIFFVLYLVSIPLKHNLRSRSV